MNGDLPARTVTEELAEFVTHWAAAGVPADVRHQAERLVLNALKGSVAAHDHPAVAALHRWESEAQARGRPAHVLWLGTTLPGESAAFVNAAMLEVLDFNENHIPNGPLHPTAPVLPVVLAEAERVGAGGRAILDALAIGVEVELALATMLMWSTYRRGFMTGVLVGGVGAAAAAAALKRLDAAQTAHALGFAMTCALGAMENFGSASHMTNTGLAARNGLLASVLAERGLRTAPTAFEGKKGMRSAYSDEGPERTREVLDALRREPFTRIFEPAFKSHPTETITQAPLTCALECAAGISPQRRREVAELQIDVEPLVAEIAADRYAQFGPAPADALQARFDLRYCVAAGWCAGRFTNAELEAPVRTDAAVLALRDRVRPTAAPAVTMESATLTARWPDGEERRVHCAAFPGSPPNPLSDVQLQELLRAHAAGLVPDARIEALIEAVWGLAGADTPARLLELARCG